MKDNKIQENESKKQKLRSSIKTALILLLLVIIGALVCVVINQKEKHVTVAGGEYIEDNGKRQEKGRTDIPILSDAVISEDSPYLHLYNPISNEGNSYLSYEFIDAADNHEIYSSEKIEPGKKFSVNFKELLDEGEHSVTVRVHSYDYDNPDIENNGTTTDIKLTVQ